MSETSEAPHASAVLDERGEIKPEYSSKFNGEAHPDSSDSPHETSDLKTSQGDTLKQIEQITKEIRDMQTRESSPVDVEELEAPPKEKKKPGSRLNIIAYTVGRLLGRK